LKIYTKLGINCLSRHRTEGNGLPLAPDFDQDAEHLWTVLGANAREDRLHSFDRHACRYLRSFFRRQVESWLGNR
jgi:hypothetical protein